MQQVKDEECGPLQQIKSLLCNHLHPPFSVSVFYFLMRHIPICVF